MNHYGAAAGFPGGLAWIKVAIWILIGAAVQGLLRFFLLFGHFGWNAATRYRSCITHFCN